MRPLRYALALALVAGCTSSQPLDASSTDASVDATPSEYTALAVPIRSTVEASYYAPPELVESRWAQFWADTEDALAESRTDREVRSRFRAAAKTLGVSHFDLFRVDTSSTSWMGGDAAPQSVTLDMGDDDVAVLTVHGSFSVERTIRPVAEAFGRVAAEEPRALVIDLRQNTGGDVSSMLLASHLIQQPAPAGLFLSKEWWETHDAVPPPSEWSGLPILTSPDMDAFFAALETQGALVGFVPPMAPYYGGPVYVLTGPNTASASEPLVYLLQSTGRATVVGQTTAGAMVSATMTELGDGWVLQHPVADYFTPDGTRLDQVGVTPDVEVPLADALDEARRLATD